MVLESNNLVLLGTICILHVLEGNKSTYVLLEVDFFSITPVTVSKFDVETKSEGAVVSGGEECDD